MKQGSWYEKIIEICYRVQTKNISNVDRVNDVLRKFHEFLKGFKIQQDLLEIRVINVTDFHSKKLDGNTLICSNRIKIEVVDDNQNWAQRLNIIIQPLVHKSFRDIKFDTISWEENFNIEVLDTIFEGEPKSSNWPSDLHLAVEAKSVDYVGDIKELEAKGLL